MVKFSFIIPTLNEEGYLAECLHSMVSQTEKNHEIIVVDSYSADKTIDIAKKYGAKVLFEKKRGPGAARNKGAGSAKGEFLIFADADTRFSGDFLEKISDIFKGTAVGGIPKLIVNDAECLSHSMAYRIINYVARFFISIGKPFTTGSCFVYRKATFLKAGGFDEKLLSNEDHDLAKRVARLGRFSYFGYIGVHTSSRRVKRMGLTGIALLYIKSSLIYLLQHGHVPNYWEL
jgi:glycosyltransferase involved in cell wall biosynthesis